MAAIGDSYNFCPACKFLWETKQRAEKCHRCLAHPVQQLSVEAVMEALDIGDARYCEANRRIQSTGNPPITRPTYYPQE